MKGFLRTLRLTLQSKTLLAGAFLCSLLIGVLWAANIGTVYPIVVILRGESVQEWLARDTVVSPPTPVPFAGPPRELVFDRVGFSYGPGAPALADVSFRVSASETLAVVGRSGPANRPSRI